MADDERMRRHRAKMQEKKERRDSDSRQGFYARQLAAGKMIPGQFRGPIWPAGKFAKPGRMA